MSEHHFVYPKVTPVSRLNRETFFVPSDLAPVRPQRAPEQPLPQPSSESMPSNPSDIARKIGELAPKELVAVN